jgi:hypothetical protein
MMRRVGLLYENEIVPFGRGAVGKEQENVGSVLAEVSVFGFVHDIEAGRLLDVARRQWTGGVVVGEIIDVDERHGAVARRLDDAAEGRSARRAIGKQGGDEADCSLFTAGGEAADADRLWHRDGIGRPLLCH